MKMARNNEFELLLDDLYAESVKRGMVADRTSKPGKLAKSRAPLRKSSPFTASIAKAQTPGKVTIHERANVGDAVKVKGKQAVPAKSVAAEPKEHVALRVAGAISEMKKHAQGRELNGAVTELQLKACKALAAAGEMSQDEVADVEKAMSDGRALPTYLLKKMGGN
jgi:hypothetical protein